MSNKNNELYCKFCKETHKKTVEFYYFKRNGYIHACKKSEKYRKKEHQKTPKGKATQQRAANKYLKKRYKEDEQFRNYYKDYSHNWYFNNKEKKAEYYKNYQRERKKYDPMFKLRKNLRNRLNSALKKKSWHKESKFTTYIGCSREELKIHLESQFKPGMTWDNYGEWHVDHKIPLISAQNEEELYKLCHFNNLQPLWAAENLAKGSKL